MGDRLALNSGFHGMIEATRSIATPLDAGMLDKSIVGTVTPSIFVGFP